MPRGDRTGPNGMGSMTGRAMGRCTGTSVGGFTSSGGGRFAGGGFGGRGGGFGRGMGRGMGGRGMQARGFVPYYEQEVTPELEKEELLRQRQVLEAEMKTISERVEILENVLEKRKSDSQ